MAEYLPFSTQEQSTEAGGLEAGNPAMTYVDFANQMARNSQAQQAQEEAIRQAQLLTKQKTAANAAGVNPELKGYLTVQEAIAQMKAAGVDDAQIRAFQEQIGDQQMVSQAAVDTVIRKKELQAKAGVPFIASDADAKNESMVTKEGDQLVSGQSYYDTGEKDAEGNAVYAHGGKEPVDQDARNASRESAATEKSWQKVDIEMNKFIRSSRGNALTQAVQRAVRALNELAEGKALTPQVLSYIQKDISGIFQGGVPPVAGQDAEDFTNVLQRVNGFIAKYTGIQGFLHKDLGDQRQYLLGLLIRLRESTVAMLKAALSSEAAAYEQIINADPERWQRLIDGKIQAAEAGLSENAKTTIDALSKTPEGNNPPAMGAKPAAGVPDINALAAALGLKKKPQ